MPDLKPGDNPIRMCSPHGEEAHLRAPDDASHRRENHEARDQSFETRCALLEDEVGRALLKGI
jgi:hypothetical protein